MSSHQKDKLRAIIEAKRIARSGIDNAYEKLADYEKLVKRLNKEKKNTDILNIKKVALEEEIIKLEETITNMQVGTNTEAGGGISGGSCASGD